ncbi:metal ABC transporter permease [Pseudaestuariivita atlantica]|uniref:Zinc ABC transporter permease n=1 Tax=Pseudaestuariivita atlantica TaxID=1317121 RepID=A0A0L1JNM9_9RHOB|nr:metal ABC transporter permease [Pseudaestuariivita atlantica]KNG93361.1 zinc ABC transporter permease [Pseudaestuariivita atlantica]
MLFDALTLQLGYNVTLVMLGAAALGMAAGGAGTYLFLRKRALVSDAVSHATLPGVGVAFLVMVLLGGDGRWLPGLLAGSALTAGIGLLCVAALTRRTRLTEDAAIGAVLSVFFGLGIVLLTIVQTLPLGRQAGLESFLLGSTAGMLRSDALLIAAGGVVTLLAVATLHRPFTAVAFDPGFAQATGQNIARIDLTLMMLVMAVTVVGLKVVGLILIVALLIIPPVAARFWTDKAETLALIAAALGGLSGYVGAGLSATAPGLPTGPIIVLVAFALFALSFLAAPGRGVVALALRHRHFQHAVHLRQGLLAIASEQPIYEALTMRILRREGLVRADGVPTDAGRGRAAKALRDETRWQVARGTEHLSGLAARHDGLTEIETVLTADQIAEIDARIATPVEVG